MIVTSAASSHQNSRSNHPSVVAIDAAHATVMAMAISSIIPGARSRTSAHGAGQERPAAVDRTRTVPSTGPDPADAGSSW